MLSFLLCWLVRSHHVLASSFVSSGIPVETLYTDWLKTLGRTGEETEEGLEVFRGNLHRIDELNRLNELAGQIHASTMDK